MKAEGNRIKKRRQNERTGKNDFMHLPLFRNHRGIGRRAGRMLSGYLLPVAGCLLLAGCQRGPQTSAELFERLPRRFQGELHVQGDAGAHPFVVELLDLSARDAHLLEFRRVHYRLAADSNGNTAAEGDAALKGTISAPGGEIRIEAFGGAGAGGEDALKPGSFQGKLSDDLQSVDTHWTTADGQAVRFEAKAGK